MGNEYFQSQHSKAKSQLQKHQRAAPDPLLRELSALSRAPSLRDPSTSSSWKPASSKEIPIRRRERELRGHTARSALQADEIVEEADEEEEEQDALRTEWQDKVVNWIDGGLREGERKQELLRSISELLNPAMEASAEKYSNAKLKKSTSMEHNRPTQNQRKLNSRARQTDESSHRRIAWKEDGVRDSEQIERETFEIRKALALTRHHAAARNEVDPGYDYDETDSSSSDGAESLVSRSQSPLLGKEIVHKQRKTRRYRKAGTRDMGCANFHFTLGTHPYKTLQSKPELDAFDGPETNHGCGLPWPYWSKQKGKNLLETAGRSFSCGYAGKITGQELIPAGNQAKTAPHGRYEHMERDFNGRKHRSLSQKYRPKTFGEMVGQTLLAQALSNAVARERIAPVYLFHGPRGTGKTSAAKILAAALNCLSMDDARPCGVCRECLLLCLGKSTDVKEVDVTSHDATGLMKKLLNDVVIAPSGRFKVFIIDECQTLTSEGWNLFLKCLEEPPEYAVFILITSDAEQLPHPVATRCQKFHFPKIKDSDIVIRLQKLAAKESLEVDSDALELIAARSNGSLRDAETTLEQLSLVGQKITLQVVQELIGLVSNARLAELLDMALIGDTLNTVKCIRDFMDVGVEPLALMSQIATLITDILAGGYVPVSDKGFFQKRQLTKDQLDKLRQALKTLSESEKQIRSSQDQTTWLTAALLQFAPDSHSGLPLSSAGTSGTPSVLAANDTSEKETIEWEPPPTKQSWDDDGFERQQLSTHTHSLEMDAENNSASFSARQESRTVNPQAHDGDKFPLDRQQKLSDTWIRVLEVSQSNILKQLLWNHGRLLSISIEGGRAVAHLEFQHAEHRSSAERSRTSISHAFQLVLGFPVEIRLHLAGEQDAKSKCDDQKHFPGSKAPPSPPKAGVPQAEYLNSRSFPAFMGRAKRETDEFTHEVSASWEQGLEGFPGMKSFSSENQSDQDMKVRGVHHELGGRQVFQLQGRRFKVKTVRNFSTDLGTEAEKPANNPENKNQKLSARQKHASSLLCWKANKVDEDEEEDVQESV